MVEDFEEYSTELKRTLGRYALTMDDRVEITVSPVDPLAPQNGVDYLRDPLCLANEPGFGETATATVETRLIEAGDAQYACVLMYSCTRIEAGTEITWTYGSAYERSGYAAGGDCPSTPSRLQDPLDMLLRSRPHPDFARIAHRLPETSEESGSSQEYDPTGSFVNHAVEVRLAALRFGNDSVATQGKRERDSLGELFGGFNPVEDAEGCLKQYNALSSRIDQLVDPNERTKARATLESADEIIFEFLEDQASICTLFGDVETTDLIKHGTPLGGMHISVATLLFEEEDGSESMTLSFWGDETVGRGAPLRFLRYAVEHAKVLVFYNSKFDNAVIAAGDEALFRRLQAKTHDPYALLREAFPSGVSLKLDTLLRLNRLDPKTATGSNAVDMYERGEFDNLERYNVRDVQALRELVKMNLIKLGNGESTTVGTLSVRQAEESHSSQGSSSQSDSTDPIDPTPNTRDLEQRSAAWFDARKGKITASIVPSLLGVGLERRDDAFETLLTGERLEATEHMLRGQRLEGEARRFYEQTYKTDVVETGLWTHPSFPWLAASPDGLVGRDGLLEIKAPQRLAKTGDAVILQATVQMAAAGRRFCDILQYAPPNAYLQRLHFDRDLFGTLLVYLRPIADVLREAKEQGKDPDDTFAPDYGRAELNEVKAAIQDTRTTFLDPAVLLKT